MKPTSTNGLPFSYWRRDAREAGEARAKIRRAGKAASLRLSRTVMRNEKLGTGLTERELRRRGLR